MARPTDLVRLVRSIIAEEVPDIPSLVRSEVRSALSFDVTPRRRKAARSKPRRWAAGKSKGKG